jgi:hypothetical protein
MLRGQHRCRDADRLNRYCASSPSSQTRLGFVRPLRPSCRTFPGIPSNAGTVRPLSNTVIDSKGPPACPSTKCNFRYSQSKRWVERYSAGSKVTAYLLQLPGVSVAWRKATATARRRPWTPASDLLTGFVATPTVEGPARPGKQLQTTASRAFFNRHS